MKDIIQEVQLCRIQSESYLFKSKHRKSENKDQEKKIRRILEIQVQPVEIEVSEKDVQDLSQREAKIFRGGSNESLRPSLVDPFAPSNEEYYVSLNEMALNSNSGSNDQSFSKRMSRPLDLHHRRNFMGSDEYEEKQDENYFSYGNEQENKKVLQSSPDFVKGVIKMSDYRPMNIKSLELDNKRRVLFSKRNGEEKAEEGVDQEENIHTQVFVANQVFSLVNNIIPLEVNSNTNLNSEDNDDSYLTETANLTLKDEENQKSPDLEVKTTILVNLDKLIELNTEEQSPANFSLSQLEYLRDLSVNYIQNINKNVQNNLTTTVIQSQRELRMDSKPDSEFNRSKSFPNQHDSNEADSMDLNEFQESTSNLSSSTNEVQDELNENKIESEETEMIKYSISELNKVSKQEDENESDLTKDFEFSELNQEPQVVSLTLNDNSTKNSFSVKSEQFQLRFGKMKSKKTPGFNIENNLTQVGREKKKEIIITGDPVLLNDKDTVHRLKIDSLGNLNKGGFAKLTRRNVSENDSKVQGETQGDLDVILIEGLDETAMKESNQKEVNYPLQCSLEIDSIKVKNEHAIIRLSSGSNWFSTGTGEVSGRQSDLGFRPNNYETDKAETVYSSLKIEKNSRFTGVQGENDNIKSDQIKEEKSIVMEESNLIESYIVEGVEDVESSKRDRNSYNDDSNEVDEENVFSSGNFNIREDFVIDIINRENGERLRIKEEFEDNKVIIKSNSNEIKSITEVTEDSKTRKGSFTNDCMNTKINENSQETDNKIENKISHVKRHSTESKYVLMGDQSEHESKENLQKLIEQNKPLVIKDEESKAFQYESVKIIKNNVNCVHNKMANYYKSEGNLLSLENENFGIFKDKNNIEIAEGWKSTIEFQKRYLVKQSQKNLEKEMENQDELEYLAKLNLVSIMKSMVCEMKLKIIFEKTLDEDKFETNAKKVDLDLKQKNNEIPSQGYEESSVISQMGPYDPEMTQDVPYMSDNEDIKTENVSNRGDENIVNTLNDHVKSNDGSEITDNVYEMETEQSELINDFPEITNNVYEEAINVIEINKENSETNNNISEVINDIIDIINEEKSITENSIKNEDFKETKKIEEQDFKISDLEQDPEKNSDDYDINLVPIILNNLLISTENYLTNEVEINLESEHEKIIKLNTSEENNKSQKEDVIDQEDMLISIINYESPNFENHLKESDIIHSDVKITDKKVERSSFYKKKQNEYDEINQSEIKMEELFSEDLKESFMKMKVVNYFSDFSLINKTERDSHLIKTEMINRSVDSSEDSYYDQEDETEEYIDDEENDYQIRSEYIEPIDYFSVEDLEMVDIIKNNKKRNNPEQNGGEYYESNGYEDSENYTYSQGEEGSENIIEGSVSEKIENNNQLNSNLVESEFEPRQSESEKNINQYERSPNQEKKLYNNLITNREVDEYEKGESNESEPEEREEEGETELESQNESSSLKLLCTDEKLGTIIIETNKPPDDVTIKIRESSLFPVSMTTKNLRNSNKLRTIKSMLLSDENRLNILSIREKEIYSMPDTDEIESNDITVSNLVNKRKDWVLKSQTRKDRESQDKISTGMDYIEMKRRFLKKKDLRKSDNIYPKRIQNNRMTISNDNYRNQRELMNEQDSMNKKDSMEEIGGEGLGIDHYKNDKTGAREEGKTQGKIGIRRDKEIKNEVEDKGEIEKVENEGSVDRILDVINAYKGEEKIIDEIKDIENTKSEDTLSDKKNENNKKGSDAIDSIDKNSRKIDKDETETTIRKIDLISKDDLYNKDTNINLENETKITEGNESNIEKYNNSNILENIENSKNKDLFILKSDFSNIVEKKNLKKKPENNEPKSAKKEEIVIEESNFKNISQKRLYKESKGNSVIRSNSELGKWEITTSLNNSNKKILKQTPNKKNEKLNETIKIDNIINKKDSQDQNTDCKKSQIILLDKGTSKNHNSENKTPQFNEENINIPVSESECSNVNESDKASIKTQQKYQMKFEEKGTIKATNDLVDMEIIDSSVNGESFNAIENKYETIQDKEQIPTKIEENLRLVNSSNLIENGVNKTNKFIKDKFASKQIKVINYNTTPAKEFKVKPLSMIVEPTFTQAIRKTSEIPKKTQTILNQRLKYITSLHTSNMIRPQTIIQTKRTTSIDKYNYNNNRDTSAKSSSTKRSVVTFVNAINIDNLPNSIYINKKEYNKYKTCSVISQRQQSVPIKENRGQSLTRSPTPSIIPNPIKQQPQQIIRKITRRVCQPSYVPSRSVNKYTPKHSIKNTYTFQNIYQKDQTKYNNKAESRRIISRSQSPSIYKVTRAVTYDHVKAKVNSRRWFEDPFLKTIRKPPNFIVHNMNKVRDLNIKKKKSRIENDKKQMQTYQSIFESSKKSIYKGKNIERKPKRELRYKDLKIQKKEIKEIPKKSEKKYLQKLKKQGHRNEIMTKQKYMAKFSVRKDNRVNDLPQREIDRISNNINRSKSPKSRVNQNKKYY